MTTNIPENEKERVRASSGEIHFNAKHHKAAAGVFAALASESQGTKAQNYWRKAIRSQRELAGWPVDPPWSETPRGKSEARVVLLDMYRKIDSDTVAAWDVASHTGLLLVATGQADEAFQYWTSKITKHPSGIAG